MEYIPLGKIGVAAGLICKNFTENSNSAIQVLLVCVVTIDVACSAAFFAVGLPLSLINCMRNYTALNSRDTGREGLVIRIDGKALFLGIQVQLNTVGILLI